MFRVCLVIVRPGEAETDYKLTMMVPALPREGDYLSVVRSGDNLPDDQHTGSEDFVVRRVSWMFVLPDDDKASRASGEGAVGMVTSIIVECEFAIGEHSSKSHRRSAAASAQHFQAKPA